MAIVLHNSILVVVEIDMISVLKCIKIRQGWAIDSVQINERTATDHKRMLHNEGEN